MMILDNKPARCDGNQLSWMNRGDTWVNEVNKISSFAFIYIQVSWHINTLYNEWEETECLWLERDGFQKSSVSLRNRRNISSHKISVTKSKKKQKCDSLYGFLTTQKYPLVKACHTSSHCYYMKYISHWQVIYSS